MLKHQETKFAQNMVLFENGDSPRKSWWYDRFFPLVISWSVNPAFDHQAEKTYPQMPLVIGEGT